MKPISDNINNIIRKIFAKKHPQLAEILIYWHRIVGIKFSNKTLPLKISTYKEKGLNVNALHIQVEHNAISTEMSYYQDIIMERIAVYLGYKAIHKIHFRVYKEATSAI